MNEEPSRFDRRAFLQNRRRDRRRQPAGFRVRARREDQGRPDAALHRHLCALGVAITNGFKLAIAEHGGKLGGREIEYFTVDDESDPAKATDNANKLVTRDKVDVLVGTVHSGVAHGAWSKVARETGTLLIIPNAGVDAATGALCAPNIFRTSFSNWQPAYRDGQGAGRRGSKKTVVTLTWNYAAGTESIGGFKEGFAKAGGTIVKELLLPFPQVEFQPLLTEIASIKPDVVYVFFAGGGAVKFVKDYAAAGLKARSPLVRPGFPHRRHARSAGRVRRRAWRPRCTTATASKRRRTRRSALHTMPRRTSCSPTSMRCRATTRACCSRPA